MGLNLSYQQLHGMFIINSLQLPTIYVNLKDDGTMNFVNSSRTVKMLKSNKNYRSAL